jgi:hypothetical protein
MAALILWPVLIELKPPLARLPRPGAFAAAAGVALLAWLGAALAPAYSEDRKQAFGIEYAADESKAQRQWLVINDGAPLPAGFEAFRPGAQVPWSARKRWAMQAPILPLAPARVQIVAERVTAQGRLLTLRLVMNGSEALFLRAGPEAGFQAVRAGGGIMRFGGGGGKDDFVLRCLGRSCEGIRIELLLSAPSKVEATLIGTRSGLPTGAEHLIGARPALAAPQYSPDSSITVGKVRL